MQRMYDKEYRKRMAVTVMAAILLMCLHVVIFGFSAQDSEASGNLSFSLSQKCVDFLETVSAKKWDEAFKENLAGYFENPIRKLAHFTEYACMGFLWQLIFIQWKKTDRFTFLFVVTWVFAVAGTDEIHQLFVPGRYGCFADVLLDTLGGIFGLTLVHCGNRLWKSITHDYK